MSRLENNKSFSNYHDSLVLEEPDLEYDFEENYDVKFGKDLLKKDGITTSTEPSDYIKDESLNELVNIIIKKAIDIKATDIMFIAKEGYGVVRYRVEGEMISDRKIFEPSYEPLIVVLKHRANIDYTKKYETNTEGSIIFSLEQEKYPLRCTFSPAMWGTSATLRVTYRESKLTLDNLGFPLKYIGVIKEILRRQRGLVFIAGQSGSGKSTTLRACVREINHDFHGRKNIKTIESPIEQIIEGVTQSQINEFHGYTYSVAVRTLLREAVDVAMIGEINDMDSAKAVIDGANSSQMILSTIHANSALNIPKAFFNRAGHQIAKEDISIMSLSIYQHRSRKLCEHCKVGEIQSPDQRSYLMDKLQTQDINVATSFKRNEEGCEHCNYEGYLGRVLISEIVPMTRRYEAILSELGTEYSESELKTKLMEDEGSNYYPFEYDVYRRYEEGFISFDQVKELIS